MSNNGSGDSLGAFFNGVNQAQKRNKAEQDRLDNARRKNIEEHHAEVKRRNELGAQCMKALDPILSRLKRLQSQEFTVTTDTGKEQVRFALLIRRETGNLANSGEFLLKAQDLDNLGFSTSIGADQKQGRVTSLEELQGKIGDWFATIAPELLEEMGKMRDQAKTAAVSAAPAVK